MIRLADRTILLTGATRGIGSWLAERLLDAGARLILPARDPADLPGGTGITPIRCDLSDPAQVRTLAQQVARDHPDCSGVLNNAAIMVHTDLTGAEPATDRIEAEIATNLTAPVLLSTLLLPVLARNRGFLCNVTSGLALTANADAAVYCGTKAGVSNFTRGLRNQIRAAGLPVSVTECLLPVVDTSLSNGAPAGKMAPSTAADHILTAIRKEQAQCHIGRARLLPPLLRLMPGRVHAMMARR